MDYLRFTLDYTEYITSVFVITTSTVSLFSNFLLLFILFNTPPDHIGSYRFLLALFSVNDIAITIGHAALQPCLHMSPSGFYFFPRNGGIVINDMPIDTILCILFVAAFYHMFLLLAYQFVYRYNTGFRDRFVLYRYWSNCHWSAIGVLVYILYMSVYLLSVEVGMIPGVNERESVPSDIYEIYGGNLSDSTVGFLFVAVRSINDTTDDEYVKSTVSLSMSTVLFGGVSLIITFCVYQISAAIDSSKTPIAPGTRKIHREMYYALLLQTAVPCIFSYIPLFSILLVGSVTGNLLGAYGSALFISTAIFPSLNALFVLYFVAKFGNAVVQLFKLPSTWANAPVKLVGSITTYV